MSTVEISASYLTDDEEVMNMQGKVDDFLRSEGHWWPLSPCSQEITFSSYKYYIERWRKPF